MEVQLTESLSVLKLNSHRRTTFIQVNWYQEMAWWSLKSPPSLQLLNMSGWRWVKAFMGLTGFNVTNLVKPAL